MLLQLVYAVLVIHYTKTGPQEVVHSKSLLKVRYLEIRYRHCEQKCIDLRSIIVSEFSSTTTKSYENII